MYLYVNAPCIRNELEHVIFTPQINLENQFYLYSVIHVYHFKGDMSSFPAKYLILKFVFNFNV